MKDMKVYIWHVMLQKFKNSKNDKETAKKIFSVHGQGVIPYFQVWN